MTGARTTGLLDSGPFYAHAPCGYVTTRLDGAIVAANPTFRRWVEAPDAADGASDDLLGRRLPDLFSPAGRVVWTAQHLPHLAATGEVSDADLDLQTAAGRLPVLVGARLVQLTTGGEVEPVPGLAAATGEPVVLLTFFDATTRRGHDLELRAARAAAQAAQHRAQLLQRVTAVCATATTTAELIRTVVVAARVALEAIEVRIWLPAQGLACPAEADREGQLPGGVPDAEHALVAAAAAVSVSGELVLLEGDSAPAGVLGRSLSVLAVPLPLEGGRRGVLTAATYRALDDDAATYGALGGVVGQALERTRLHTALEHLRASVGAAAEVPWSAELRDVEALRRAADDDRSAHEAQQPEQP